MFLNHNLIGYVSLIKKLPNYYSQNYKFSFSTLYQYDISTVVKYDIDKDNAILFHIILSETSILLKLILAETVLFYYYEIYMYMKMLICVLRLK